MKKRTGRTAKIAPLNVILLGDPNAGKATQAARMVKKYRLHDFDMGREVRRPSVRASFDYGRTTARGNLTPTAVVRGILRRVIGDVPRGRGILFDGHPKMIGEAKLVARLLKENGRTDPLVLYLSIPQVEVVRRMKKRMRDDDTPEALARRERYYREQIDRVVKFFGGRYDMRKISGMGTAAEVWKRIDGAIKEHAA